MTLDSGRHPDTWPANVKLLFTRLSCRASANTTTTAKSLAGELRIRLVDGQPIGTATLNHDYFIRWSSSHPSAPPPPREMTVPVP